MEIIFGLSLWKSIEVFLDWGFKLTLNFQIKAQSTIAECVTMVDYKKGIIVL